jgi:hypothetical protein
MRRALTVLLAAALLSAALAPAASAGLVSAGVQPGVAHQAAVATPESSSGSGGGGLCSTFDVVVTIGVSCGVKALVGAAGSALGSVVSSVGGSVLDAIAGWVIGAATTITGFIAKEITTTASPQLTSSWYSAQFAPMAALGAGLALLVTLIALTSAALRRNSEELARTLAGIVRAGIGTAVVIALTMIGLGVADAISSEIVTTAPASFWNTLAQAWGHSQFGGFGSSMLAALVALVEVIGALAVWLELIVRNAAIYIAVLFFPVALAAGIWRPLAGWPGRLGRLLLLFVMLKPVALIVLSLAGNAAAAGISGSAGVATSIGTILAAVVIFALAAFAPWGLMFLLAAEAESAWQGNALRGGLGDARGRASGAASGVGGGIARLRRGTSGGSPESGASSRSSGGQRGGGGGGGGRGGSPSQPSLGGQAAGGRSASSPGGAVAAGAVGGGSVAAAAGMTRTGGQQAAASIATTSASTRGQGETENTAPRPAALSRGGGEHAETPHTPTTASRGAQGASRRTPGGQRQSEAPAARNSAATSSGARAPSTPTQTPRAATPRPPATPRPAHPAR